MCITQYLEPDSVCMVIRSRVKTAHFQNGPVKKGLYKYICDKHMHVLYLYWFTQN